MNRLYVQAIKNIRQKDVYYETDHPQSVVIVKGEIGEVTSYENTHLNIFVRFPSRVIPMYCPRTHLEWAKGPV